MKLATIAILATGSLAAAVTGIVVATSQQSGSDRPSDPLLDSNAPMEPSVASPPAADSLSSSADASPDAQDSPSDESDPMSLTYLEKPSTPVHDLFDSAIAEMRSRTQVPMLMPSALPDAVLAEPIYIHPEAEANYYTVVLGLTPDCGANVCSIGSMEAEMGGSPYPEEFRETVQLTQGIQGYFQPMTCGASCSPPVIAWNYEGAFYRMYLKMPGTDAEVRGVMIEVANSAIAQGAR